MPPIPQDNTDRNRTSPMAFTGNKFEFRMLGSSQSISGPNIALNTIMAEELQQFADQLEKSKNFQSDLEKLIKKVFTDHQRIIFNGNGYDDAWIAEAEKRGLSNLKSAADALPVYTAKKNVDTGHGVLLYDLDHSVGREAYRSFMQHCADHFFDPEMTLERLRIYDLQRHFNFGSIEKNYEALNFDFRHHGHDFSMRELLEQPLLDDDLLQIGRAHV